MGYIYKITNLINGRCYIGQTTQTINKRFSEHKRNRKYSYFQHLNLYKAFNKYGIENFKIEEIKKVSLENIDAEEIKAIAYYDSFNQGYNMTLGGKSCRKLSLCEEKIIEDYLKMKSARKVAEKHSVDHSTIDSILNKNNVPRYSFGSQRSKRVIVEKENNKINFDCMKYVAKWFVDNKICKAKTTESARKGVANSIKKATEYYGYKIYYEQ